MALNKKTQTTLSKPRMPTAWVISADWQLRALLRAELKEAGIVALGLESADALVEDLGTFGVPSAIVLDGAELEKTAVRERITELAQNVPVLVVESAISATPEVQGIDVLRRPVRVKDIVAWVLARVS